MDLDRLKTGSETTWNQAYPILWTIARSSASQAHPCLTAEDHEDIAIHAIREWMKQIGAVTSEQGAKLLLSTIAHHQAISFARKKLSQKRGAGKMESIEEKVEATGDSFLDSHDLSPAELLQNAEMTAAIQSALKGLEAPYGQMLADRYFDDFDYRALAQKHGLSENSVGVYLRRGLEKLRAALSLHGNILKEIAPVLR